MYSYGWQESQIKHYQTLKLSKNTRNILKAMLKYLITKLKSIIVLLHSYNFFRKKCEPAIHDMSGLRLDKKSCVENKKLC